jgi:hypothetical protein
MVEVADDAEAECVLRGSLVVQYCSVLFHRNAGVIISSYCDHALKSCAGECEGELHLELPFLTTAPVPVWATLPPAASNHHYTVRL